MTGDFSRVLILLGVVAGLLIGLAIGWRMAGRALLEGSGHARDRASDEWAQTRGAESRGPESRGQARAAAANGAAGNPAAGPEPPREGGGSRIDPEVLDRPPIDDDDAAEPGRSPGITASELRAQDDFAEPPDRVAVRPPEFDISEPSDAPALVETRSVSRPGWFEGAVGYERALVERSRRAAPLIVYFHTDWCAYCRRFDEEFLANEPVGDWLSRALRVEINPESGDAELALARRFGIRGYPGFFVVRPDSEEAVRVHPFRRGQTISTKQFLSELKDAAGEG